MVFEYLVIITRFCCTRYYFSKSIISNQLAVQYEVRAYHRIERGGTRYKIVRCSGRRCMETSYPGRN